MESKYAVVPLGEIVRPILVRAQQEPAPVLTFKGLHTSGRLDLLPSAAGRFAAAQRGDVIFTKQGHVAGWVLKKVGLVTRADCDTVYVASTLQALRPTTRVLPAWLYLWLSASSTYDLVQELVGARNSITGPVLASIPVPLPPLHIQRRIVARLEEHLARLDAGATALQAASTRADALERSGLHELWCGASGGAKLQPIAAVAKVVTGSTPREAIEDSNSETLGFLTPGDVGSGQRITTTHRSFSSVSIAGSRATRGPAAYTVCIGATLGKVGWATQPLGFNQQINAVLTEDASEAQFLATVMASPRFQEQMRSEASATTMPILNKSRFCALELPMPPADVRDRLLARFEDVSLASQRLRQGVASVQARRAGLRRALMAAAFSGRLTGTNQVEEASDV